MANENVVVKNPPGKGELNKENILDFLNSFKIRTGMYVDKPEDYDVVISFLRGYMYCCYLHGYPCIIDFAHFPKRDEQDAIEKFIECLIAEIE